LAERAVQAYLRYRVRRIFGGDTAPVAAPPASVEPPRPDAARLASAADRIVRAQRPVVLVGSQALVEAGSPERLVAALERIGAPVYLSGTARGLLGRDHPLQARHQRRVALKEADVVVLAGVPADFRLDYGNHVRRSACLISINRSRTDLRRNRRPDVAVPGDAALGLAGIADALPPAGSPARWTSWRETVAGRDAARETEIDAQAAAPSADGVNPVALCRELATALPEGAVVVGDGGDIVATAAYTVATDGPLQWLDPGVFGTLGVGAGFALGAKLVHPDRPVWIVFGDGSVGYSLTEFDTFVRHDLPVVAVVGNDASWSQIAREQVEMLGDDVGTVLAHTRYDRVAEGFGALGLHVEEPGELPAALKTAAGSTDRPVLLDVRLGRSDFRKGSISM
jgi:acetolactate synthase-like protein